MTEQERIEGQEEVLENDQDLEESQEENQDEVETEDESTESVEDLKKEINRLNNKLRYKTKSKPKTKENVDLDVLLEQKLAERDFKAANPDVNMDEFKKFMDEKGLSSFDDALALQEGLKLRDPGYANQLEAGKAGLHGNFAKKKVEKPDPFAKWPAISQSKD